MNLDWYEENNIPLEKSVGVDEVGRGSLAGPVMAASVWLNSELVSKLEESGLEVRDSKKMTAPQRKKVVDWIKSQPKETIRFATASATAEEIDDLNILKATLLAMKRSYDRLGISVEYVLIDGNKAPAIPNTNVRAFVKGDDKVLSISLASIVIKEYRDNFMRKLALEYPDYRWETNVGYGSAQHMRAILEHGATSYHRKTFAPIKNLKNMELPHVAD
jgi:ribonuclease HII